MKSKPQSTKATGTSLVKWQEKFAGLAKKAVDKVKNVGGGVSIRWKHGGIEVGGLPVKDGKLACVIMGACAFNAWNRNKYDPDNTQPPDCYAFADAFGDPDMVPHEEASDKQCATCAECPHNEWGTAEVGRGKACGNNMRIALLTAADLEDAKSVASAEMATAKVSVTNVKHYAAYAKMLNDEYGRPPWAVVTEVQSHADPKTQIRLEFRFVELIDDPAILAALEARIGEDDEKVKAVLMKPFPPPTEKPAARPRAGASKKFAAAKAGRR
jgi:hypothetical protein